MKRLRPAFLACVLAATPVAATEPPSFNEHIRPILADNCLACHGLDAGKRKAKLRLDIPEGAYAEHNGNRAVVPGDLERSELWHRITSQDPDDVMPPPESHKQVLTTAQRDLIRQWILGGARYEPHWAFAPIARPSPPPAQGGAGEHPVDRFIGQKLAGRGLTLAAEAPREVLLRRLALDLTGLSLPELDQRLQRDYRL